MLQIFQTATSQRAALYTKCQLLLQGSVKLKKTVILEWKSHKSKAQSSGVCIKIKKKLLEFPTLSSCELENPEMENSK